MLHDLESLATPVLADGAQLSDLLQQLQGCEDVHTHTHGAAVMGGGWVLTHVHLHPAEGAEPQHALMMGGGGDH